MKKKALAIAPIMPHPSDITSIATSLSFLNDQYQIEFLDPLSLVNELPNQLFYQQWQDEIASQISSYDLYIGFSFGGMILQQCFPMFASYEKSILLFSTPTFSNPDLHKKLSQVIYFCQKADINSALKTLYQTVFYPNHIPIEVLSTPNAILAANRLINGLQRVLSTDSRAILDSFSVSHLHLIGELSQLVNANNVLAGKAGCLRIVPGAGMRVLQNNLPYCKKIIDEQLNGKL